MSKQFWLAEIGLYVIPNGVPTELSAEIEALSVAYQALSRLDDAALNRAMSYLNSRLLSDRNPAPTP